MSYIFDIKRYAINDGPGVRIAIFLKGCPLACEWCHNPEGIKRGQSKLYTKRKCIGCGSCVEECPHGALSLTSEGIVTDESLCTLCGRCADVCPTLAIEMAGRSYTTEELMVEIQKERAIMDTTHGGVTFCGGEPLMHPTTLLPLLKRCGEESIHRCVDTTLFASSDLVRAVAEECELFLVDLKQMDSARHKEFTNVPNEVILKNIRLISELGARFWIRIPLIDGVNSDVDNLERSAEFLASLPTPPEVVNILIYHDIGKSKHERLGTEYNPLNHHFETPDESTQQSAIEIFARHGINATIGG